MPKFKAFQNYSKEKFIFYIFLFISLSSKTIKSKNVEKENEFNIISFSSQISEEEEQQIRSLIWETSYVIFGLSWIIFYFKGDFPGINSLEINLSFFMANNGYLLFWSEILGNEIRLDIVLFYIQLIIFVIGSLALLIYTCYLIYTNPKDIENFFNFSTIKKLLCPDIASKMCNSLKDCENCFIKCFFFLLLILNFLSFIAYFFLFNSFYYNMDVY